MKTPSKPLLETIYHLRTIEQVILYVKIGEFSKEEEKETIDFLESEYEKESLDYPFTVPAFDAEAALWAAKIVYNSAQLLLHRNGSIEGIPAILPPFTDNRDAAAMLAADLCLRFLPQLLINIRIIDPDDALIPILEEILVGFPYSALSRESQIIPTDISVILENNCLKQLYLDRITSSKIVKEARLTSVYKNILANLGDHKEEFWRELSPADPTINEIS